MPGKERKPVKVNIGPEQETKTGKEGKSSKEQETKGKITGCMLQNECLRDCSLYTPGHVTLYISLSEWVKVFSQCLVCRF